MRFESHSVTAFSLPSAQTGDKAAAGTPDFSRFFFGLRASTPRVEGQSGPPEEHPEAERQPGGTGGRPKLPPDC